MGGVGVTGWGGAFQEFKPSFSSWGGDVASLGEKEAIKGLKDAIRSVNRQLCLRGVLEGRSGGHLGKSLRFGSAPWTEADLLVSVRHETSIDSARGGEGKWEGGTTEAKVLPLDREEGDP